MVNLNSLMVETRNKWQGEEIMVAWNKLTFKK
jgi:hypothetical protein